MSAAEYLNQLDLENARRMLGQCCASQAWVDTMLRFRPFRDEVELESAAEKAADLLQRDDWMEAFAGHPRIGDIDSLRTKYASTKAWASNEQAGVSMTNEDVLVQLARCNDLYFDKFGYIFIICATGKTAEQMLENLRSRLANAPEVELKLAADEQLKITQIRLRKLSELATQ